MEDGGEDMELKYELWKESIFQEKVIYECRKRLSGYRRAVFCVIGNSLEFPITQKGTNVPMMRTRAKQKHVASDRARRENVPRHILFAIIKKCLITLHFLFV